MKMDPSIAASQGKHSAQVLRSTISFQDQRQRVPTRARFLVEPQGRIHFNKGSIQRREGASPSQSPPATRLPDFSPGGSAADAAGISENIEQIGSQTSYLPPDVIGHPTVSRSSDIPGGRRSRRNSGMGHIPGSRAVSIKDGYTPGNPYTQATQESAKDSGTFSSKALNVILLLLPLLYFSRVTAIFTEVNCTGETLREAIKKNVQELRLENDEPQDAEPGLRTPSSAHIYWDTTGCPAEVERLKELWDDFINTITKEWETMNLVAVLLLSAIISSMQIGPVFADEIVRYIAFAALVCSLMSLICCCTYIIRFSIMRPVHKAVEWAREGEKAKTALFWNVWIFLSVPAIWLSWALILFVAEIIAFLWLIDTPDSAKALSPKLRLVAKIAISGVLLTGLLYLALILHTLKRYGSEMDEQWKKSIDDSASPRNRGSPISLKFPSYPSHSSLSQPRSILHPGASQEYGLKKSLSRTPAAPTTDYFGPEASRIMASAALTQSPEPLVPKELPEEVGKINQFYRPVLAVRFAFGSIEYSEQMPPVGVLKRLGSQSIWSEFVEEIVGEWNTVLPHNPDGVFAALLRVLQRWNRGQLKTYQLEAVLCGDMTFPANQQRFGVYVTDLSVSSDITRRFKHAPEGLEQYRNVYDDTGKQRGTLAPPPSKIEEPPRLVLPPVKDESVRDDTAERHSVSEDGTFGISVRSPSTYRGSMVSLADPLSARGGGENARDVALERETRVSPQIGMSNLESTVSQPPRSHRPGRTASTPSLNHQEDRPSKSAAVVRTASLGRKPLAKDGLKMSPRLELGPGISPLLKRSLSQVFLFDHHAEIRDKFTAEELASPATLVPTENLIIHHKHIPYKLCIRKASLITVGDLLEQLGQEFQTPVPENYLRGSESDTMARLRTSATERCRIIDRGKPRPFTDHNLYISVICTADWIWTKDIRICGFLELPNGTWELVTREP